MKSVIRVSIFITALFFAVGGFLAWRGSLNATTYIVLTGIIGSIASVIGLVALASPRLTATDIRDVDADLVKELSTTMQTVRDYEAQASAGKREIDRLAQERAEIELLVRQASLKAFMEERLRHIALELNKKLDTDIALSDLLQEYGITLERVAEIDGRIERSERADLILRVLAEVQPRLRKEEPPKPVMVKFMGSSFDIGPTLVTVSKTAQVYAEFISRMLK